MNDSPAATGQVPWKKSRYGFAAFWLVSLLACWLVLRAALTVIFHPSGMRLGEALEAFASGLQRDVFVAVLMTLPLLFWFIVVPEARLRGRWHRVFFWTACGLFWFLQIFGLFVEYFFFEEFRSRYNTVAVDYLLYPQEVFVNIWESYHVGIVIAGCALVTVAWIWGATKLFPRMWERPFSRKARWAHLGGAVALAAVIVPTIHLKGVHVSNDRTLNEIANNGSISFVAAAWTRHLDYAAFYRTMPREEAYQRARRLVEAPGVEFAADPYSIERRVPGDPARPRLNVVIILEESLGSEFWGCLGRKDSLTPEMDKLAAEEGLLFTDIYATGNRTVRGMEGVLASFPPLPGDSIVKRDLSDNVETLARVLKRDGYSTLFIYGGRGLFDGMRSFAVRNGYDRFIEQKHFEHPTFSTIWGVCDEDLFARGIEECRQLAATGKPFFTTLLTVSNHKPYTYPKGRIPEDPDRKKREYAVKYSDFALGEFFRAAKKETFWTNTVFVVAADHGARVYGKQTIPIHSYEIPVVIAGPAAVQQPARVAELGCSLDVPTTILGLIGRPYDSVFFGRDLLRSKPEQGRALLNHNRDIGMLAGDRMAVLGLMQNREFYGGNPKKVEMSLLDTPSKSDEELEKDTIALFQVADDLYIHERYRVTAPSLHAADKAAPAQPGGPGQGAP